VSSDSEADEKAAKKDSKNYDLFDSGKSNGANETLDELKISMNATYEDDEFDEDRKAKLQGLFLYFLS
jgi:hypothetical protein